MTCKHCHKGFPDSYRNRKRQFCDSSCQQGFYQAQLLAEWLSSGVIPNWTGGKSGKTPHGAFLRNYLLTEQNHQCAECGIYDEWYDKPLVFILDHIDGVVTHNARSNLRLICPNCNSQSSTFAGRNAGQGRKSQGFTKVPQ